MQIYDVEAGNGKIGISPLPGLFLSLEEDVAAIVAWGGRMVMSMVGEAELPIAQGGLGLLLANRDVVWIHLPVVDFGAPSAAVEQQWPGASQAAHAVLDQGGRVLVHCRGGCGRSGMAALRLLVERGEEPASALRRLRAVRPCAVENQGQLAWASAGR